MKDLLDAYSSEWPFIQHKGTDREFVIVPDVHGRLDFVLRVFEAYPDKQIVFLGDILHSENAERWAEIEKNFKKRAYSETRRGLFCDMMKQEAEESLACLSVILRAQAAQPERVFLLRGNHDDVKEDKVGAYGKYTQFMESSYFKDWCKDNLPRDIYKALLTYEDRVPYVFRSEFFCASHAAPGFNVHNCRKGKDWNLEQLHRCFTWTDNRHEPYSMMSSWSDNMTHFGNPGVWFIGHRPVNEGLTRIQMDGKLVQLNHPDYWSVIEVDGPNWVAKELV